MSSSRSRGALLDKISCQSSLQRSLPLADCILTGGTICASRRGAPQPPSMGRLSELRALFLFGGQPRVGLEDSGVVSWIVESLRVGFRIPFDRRPPYPSGFSLPDSVIASVYRYSCLNQGTSSPSSEGTSRNSLSVSRLSSSSRRFRGRGTPSLTSHPDRLCHLVSST